MFPSPRLLPECFVVNHNGQSRFKTQLQSHVRLSKPSHTWYEICSANEAPLSRAGLPRVCKGLTRGRDAGAGAGDTVHLLFRRSAEIGAWLIERAFYDLDVQVTRTCSAEVPMPYARHLEQAALPQADTIVATATRMVLSHG